MNNTYIGEALDNNGDKQAEQDIVAKEHENYEVDGGPRSGLFHARVEHLVPVLFGQDLEDCDRCPEEGVVVLAVDDLLAVLVNVVEFAAEQMHAQCTKNNNNSKKIKIKTRIKLNLTESKTLLEYGIQSEIT